MPTYSVNKNAQSNGDHEAHKSGYSNMPSSENRNYLDEFTNCHDVVREAKNLQSVTIFVMLSIPVEIRVAGTTFII